MCWLHLKEDVTVQKRKPVVEEEEAYKSSLTKVMLNTFKPHCKSAQINK